MLLSHQSAFIGHVHIYAAEEFDPDRFLDERVKKYLVNNSFIFLPFNAGPRICLGQQVRPCYIFRTICFNEIFVIVCLQ